MPVRSGYCPACVVVGDATITVDGAVFNVAGPITYTHHAGGEHSIEAPVNGDACCVLPAGALSYDGCCPGLRPDEWVIRFTFQPGDGVLESLSLRPREERGPPVMMTAAEILDLVQKLEGPREELTLDELRQLAGDDGSFLPARFDGEGKFR